MFDKPHYLVSFILDNQPQSRTLQHEGDELDPQLAQSLLKERFAELKDARLSDVQVQKRTKPVDEGHDIPGHYRQP
ncbi:MULTISPECIES: hypothetical protein [unclassified Pseudomonas]|uniref:hypothetical protein n=1 Tax=unclassified Pseudomonas TaxID=196821 RepID=UPI00277DF468|nr:MULTISPECIES: hypothetical protein [unclassified Pseudomonas]MDQ0740421.1 hypothetical protein [Pseudomonas sp. W4I3]WPN95225.1 hypothetical protein SC319_12910 [Pseudomonas sp. MUP56]WPO00753.1 hypothetical protein SC318_12910 [Pseudomonas sp. MUP55]